MPLYCLDCWCDDQALLAWQQGVRQLDAADQDCQGGQRLLPHLQAADLVSAQGW